MLAEEELDAFDRLKITGSGKRLVNSLTAKKNALKKAADLYTQVFKYKRLEWILAAQYRRGYLLQRYANTLVDTPVPPEVKRLGDDAVIAYQELIANEAMQFEDQAAIAYEQTVQVARENRVSNEWTRRTLESLNRLKPKEFPVLKEPKELLRGRRGVAQRHGEQPGWPHRRRRHPGERGSAVSARHLLLSTVALGTRRLPHHAARGARDRGRPADLRRGPARRPAPGVGRGPRRGGNRWDGDGGTQGRRRAAAPRAHAGGRVLRAQRAARPAGGSRRAPSVSCARSCAAIPRPITPGPTWACCTSARATWARRRPTTAGRWSSRPARTRPT